VVVLQKTELKWGSYDFWKFKNSGLGIYGIFGDIWMNGKVVVTVSVGSRVPPVFVGIFWEFFI
jgi:hypothetical protein